MPTFTNETPPAIDPPAPPDAHIDRPSYQFDLSVLPAGVSITQAQLGLYYDGHCISTTVACGQYHTIEAHRMTSAWNYNSTTSQLTYDTGMLTRDADVPVAVSEGLATYGELWQNAARRIGQVNRPRLDVLRSLPDAKWIALSDLIKKDELFSEADLQQVAYAESCLMIYHLMQTRRVKLKAYLETLRGSKDPKTRVAVAEGALGRLDVLERELKRSARRL